MKKLLIFMLVFGLTSMAHAVAVVQLAEDDVTDGLGIGESAQEITLTPDDDTVEISFYSSTADPWTRYFGVSPETGIGTFSAWTIYPAAGDDATVSNDPYGYTGYWYVEAKDAAEPFNLAAGEQFMISYTATSFDNDVQTITLYNETWTAGGIDMLKITQIPEPITIALLGLGGLFLRRRK